MAMNIVRLELARDQDFPYGSQTRGYELRVPLTPEGLIDPDAWRDHRKSCTVRRFWEGEDDENGHVRRTRGGDWVFHYDLEGDPDEDETGYRFQAHLFKEGEYVSVREHDGEMRTFRVVSVKPLVV